MCFSRRRAPLTVLLWLPLPVVAALSFTLFVTVLVLSFALLLPAAILKLLLPIPAVRRWLTRVMNAVGAGPWWAGNRLIFRLLLGARPDYVIEGALRRDRSWLLLSNHRSWVDIPLLVDVLGRELPFPRFFLKRELLWVPIIGFAGWAFDMPFMKRHTREAIAANPALAHDDLDTTRRACDRFRDQPVTVINFLEGTRFTAAKRDAQGAPHRHLLRPKSGGLAFALAAMGEQFAGVVDVTIAYGPSPQGPLWSFLGGRQRRLRVHVQLRPLPPELLGGDYQGDPVFRRRFQSWVGMIWREKDAELDAFVAAAACPAQGRD